MNSNLSTAYLILQLSTRNCHISLLSLVITYESKIPPHIRDSKGPNRQKSRILALIHLPDQVFLRVR
jgi:hypothetical protein